MSDKKEGLPCLASLPFCYLNTDKICHGQSVITAVLHGFVVLIYGTYTTPVSLVQL